MTGVLQPHYSLTARWTLRRECVGPIKNNLQLNNCSVCGNSRAWVLFPCSVHVYHFSFVIPYLGFSTRQTNLCTNYICVHIYSTYICVSSYPLCNLCTAVVAGVHLYQPTHSLGERLNTIMCTAHPTTTPVVHLTVMHLTAHTLTWGETKHHNVHIA